MSSQPTDSQLKANQPSSSSKQMLIQIDINKNRGSDYSQGLGDDHQSQCMRKNSATSITKHHQKSYQDWFESSSSCGFGDSAAVQSRHSKLAANSNNKGPIICKPKVFTMTRVSQRHSSGKNYQRKSCGGSKPPSQ